MDCRRGFSIQWSDTSLFIMATEPLDNRLIHPRPEILNKSEFYTQLPACVLNQRNRIILELLLR
ncbi:MAG: hypothetical protein V2J55_18960 [Candidatus Competibacteraceae bacterium]|jgi:hypothetical protein|nr:hypothetical protein [Candidatus Competibacteraceae bacterium]